MSTVAPATGERIITAAEERRVIVASSVGTVFEWYDFYLYATLAPFFASPLLPEGERHGGPPLGVRHLRGGLPRPSVRRHLLRPDRRPRRPQVHVPRDDRPSWAARRPSSASSRRSRRIGWFAPDPARRPPLACRAWPSAASTAARRPTSPSTLRREARLRDELDPDDRHRRLLPGPRRHRHLPHDDEPGRRSRPGAGAFRSSSRSSSSRSPSTSGSGCRNRRSSSA